MTACIAWPVSPPPLRAPVGVRSRLWLRAASLGQHNEDAFLWLHLRDGRVLAFRLPRDAFGDDRTIGALVAQVADDRRGTLLEVPLAQGVAVPLYAAPAAPVPVLPWGDPTQTAARAFAEGLDQHVLTLLASLNRHRVWDSLRNYNRVAALAPEIRERRLQALTRFPVLVAPVLLSAHQRLDLAGGKRHAWRDHSDEVIAAVEQGRDLIGALTRRSIPPASASWPPSWARSTPLPATASCCASTPPGTSSTAAPTTRPTWAQGTPWTWCASPATPTTRLPWPCAGAASPSARSRAGSTPTSPIASIRASPWGVASPAWMRGRTPGSGWRWPSAQPLRRDRPARARPGFVGRTARHAKRGPNRRFAGLGIEEDGFALALLLLVPSRRVSCQQIAEIRRRAVVASDREQHGGSIPQDTAVRR